MTTVVGTVATTAGRIRFTIVVMLFVITMINYADRATIAIAGPVVSKDLGLSSVQMGFIFSTFGWIYVMGQVPGGWLLEHFGSKSVYFASIFIWSLFTKAPAKAGAVHR